MPRPALTDTVTLRSFHESRIDCYQTGGNDGTRTMSEWPFSDPPNVAVIVNRKIICRGDWIANVSHDSDDGAWQFHLNRGDELSENDAMVVSLKEIVDLDPTIRELADLPLGWRAWRASSNSPWLRGKLG